MRRLCTGGFGGGACAFLSFVSFDIHEMIFPGTNLLYHCFCSPSIGGLDIIS